MREQTEKSATWRRVALPLLLILLGISLRAIPFFDNRSLWGDEAALVLNVTRSSFPELMAPLEYRQAAAVGFLALVKLAVTVFGDNEFALRLVPFLAGVLCVPLFWFWIRGLLSRWGGLFALLLFALCDPLIYYATEVKQYSTDVLVCLVLMWTAQRVAVDGRSRLVAWAVLGLGGAAGLWISHAAVFVCGGIALTFIVRAGFRRDSRQLWAGTIVAGFWMAGFAVEYFLVLRHTAALETLTRFWQPAFMPLPPRSLEELAWFPRTFLGVFQDPLGLRPAPLGAAALLAGGVFWARRHAWSLVLVASPIFLALIASGLGRFPFASNAQDPILAGMPELFHPQFGRVILFIVPLLIAILCSGLDCVLSARRRAVRIAGVLLAGALAVSPVLTAARNAWEPPDIHDVRGLVEEFVARHEPGDVVLNQTYSGQALDYYLGREGRQLRLIGSRLQQPGDAERLHRKLGRFPAGTRIWLLTVHHPRWDSENEQRRIVEVVRRHAEPVERLERHRAAAILFEVRPGREAG